MTIFLGESLSRPRKITEHLRPEVDDYHGGFPAVTPRRHVTGGKSVFSTHPLSGAMARPSSGRR
jgi:hypothetical protein